MADVLPIRNRPERRFPFTSERVEKYPAPATGRILLTDVKCPDLKLLVTSAGSRSYYVYRKHNGRPVRLLIGPVEKIGLDDARNRAKAIVGDMLKGIDPRAVKREARAGLTFGELAETYIEEKAKPEKKSWREDQRQLDTYLSTWRTRLISEIHRPHVAALHAKLGKENGKYAANRVLALLSTLFGFADKRFGWNGDNPCEGVDRFTETKRARFLQPAEMPKFFEAVNAEPNPDIRDFVYVALLTGARRSNVLAMRWADLDIDRGLWSLDENKSGKPIMLPLVPEVVRILRSRTNQSEYVFPGRYGRGHMKDPMRGWRDILKRAGIENLRIHDLRRTFGSWQAAAGVSLPIIGKSLGHTSTAATEIYSRLHLDPVRDAVTTATSAIIKAGKKGGKK